MSEDERVPAIFMDRDGTLSHEVGYVNHLSRFRLYPWSVDAVRMINRAGWRAVVVTNQAGVARGYFPESLVHEVHASLRAAMEAGGARLDGVFFCPHHPSVGEPPYRQDCDCRKPRPGLIRRAESELGIDVARSWVVGDRHGDLALAWNAGAKGALVKSGYGAGELVHHAPRWPRPPDLVAGHLLEAVERILSADAGRGGMKARVSVLPSAERLAAVVRSFRGRRLLVLADLVADEFVYGRAQRVSREAPVLILLHDGTDVRLGGGANAVHNILTLGGRPLPLGVLGRDAHGRTLLSLLRAKRIATAGVVLDPAYATPVKSRILAGGVHSTKQQIVRLDRETRLPARSAARRAVLEALRGFRGRVDGVLVSDYGFGLLTPGLVRAAVAFARRRRIPVTVDSRYGLLAFRGMTAVTPNEPEVEAALGISIGHDRGRLESAGRALLRRLGVKAVLITRGSHGMALFEPGRPPLHVPIYGSDQVADVTGAGDTVIATFTLALAAGASPTEASLLANCAGGIVVMKSATAAVSSDELLAAVSGARS